MKYNSRWTTVKQLKVTSPQTDINASVMIIIEYNNDLLEAVFCTFSFFYLRTLNAGLFVFLH